MIHDLQSSKSVKIFEEAFLHQLLSFHGIEIESHAVQAHDFIHYLFTIVECE